MIAAAHDTGNGAEASMARLMVSARSPGDAEAAIAGGASLVDIKEPANGALGAAPAEVASAIARAVGGRTPLALALGEWDDVRDRPLESSAVPPGVAYLKPGLAGTAGRGGRLDSTARREYRRWRHESLRALARDDLRWVAVVYADWQAARAPSAQEVLELAADADDFGALLVDTHSKAPARSPLGGLFDHLDDAALARIVERCAAIGVEVALSGALTAAGVARAAALGADIVGVRTAACRGGRREGNVDIAAVRELAARACGASVVSGLPPEG